MILKGTLNDFSVTIYLVTFLLFTQPLRVDHSLGAIVQLENIASAPPACWTPGAGARETEK